MNRVIGLSKLRSAKVRRNLLIYCKKKKSSDVTIVDRSHHILIKDTND